ncbi:MAG: 16S rRNA (guanine(966)-N(2))-methyltransferase RsmD [Hyphomicrobiaceae bacterium]|nr:16S rRNA (guanine(966)-N(2))-methyltransferase RsmD [Hyphomicrobiaceae bacterium]
MRVVGGKLRGRPLASPGDERLRPTSDRVREAVFNILTHGIADFTLPGAKVIDLFAGTGALGLEALSRGASFCLFVEQDAEARGLIRRNVEAFGLAGVTKIFRRDASGLGPAGSRDRFTLLFADPPYGRGLAEKALVSAADGSWLAEGAVAVVEEGERSAIALPAGFTQIDRRVWGSTQVVFARYRPPVADSGAPAK